MEKNKGGRPMKFKTVKELEDRIENYFLSITYERALRDEHGNEVINGLGNNVMQKLYTVPPTITGLAIHLGTGRSTLMDYQNKDKFSNTIKMAKDLIEEQYERRLVKRGNGGDIFALKNFGWVDKQEIAQTGTYSGNVTILNDADEVKKYKKDM